MQMIKLMDILTEGTTKVGFEVIKQITGGKTSQFGNKNKHLNLNVVLHNIKVD